MLIKNCTKLKQKKSNTIFWLQASNCKVLICCLLWLMRKCKYVFFVSENTGEYKAEQQTFSNRIMVTGTLCSIKALYNFTLCPSLFPSSGVRIQFRMQSFSSKCKNGHADFTECIYVLPSNLME